MFGIDSLLKLFENELQKVIAVVFIISFMVAFTIGTVIIMTTPIVSK